MFQVPNGLLLSLTGIIDIICVLTLLICVISMGLTFLLREKTFNCPQWRSVGASTDIFRREPNLNTLSVDTLTHRMKRTDDGNFNITLPTHSYQKSKVGSTDILLVKKNMRATNI